MNGWEHPTKTKEDKIVELDIEASWREWEITQSKYNNKTLNTIMAVYTQAKEEWVILEALYEGYASLELSKMQ